MVPPIIQNRHSGEDCAPTVLGRAILCCHGSAAPRPDHRTRPGAHPAVATTISGQAVTIQVRLWRNTDIVASLRALPDPLPDVDAPSPTHGHALIWSSADFGQANVARRGSGEDPDGP